ncbi:MAG: roadblock/LC7 domain-containing protein [Nitrospinae bacterium]|nr:roadblock/LC7 domain-containing protein [Nitrospinota bacterium]
MNPLKGALKNLCGPGGMTGALIITKDGMLIESHLEGDVRGETLGAFMSQVALTIKNGMAPMGHTAFTRYIMQSSQGKIYLEDLGKSLLIALSGLDVDSGKVNVALFQAANEIKKTGRLDV